MIAQNVTSVQPEIAPVETRAVQVRNRQVVNMDKSCRKARFDFYRQGASCSKVDLK